METTMNQSILKLIGKLINLLLIVIVMVTSGFLEFGNLPSHKGGFYCKDPALSHSFKGDTVTSVAILGPTIFGPLVIMIVTEAIIGSKKEYRLKSLKASVNRTVYWYKRYACSYLFLFFLIEIVKCVYGEPRPHFLETCKPDAAEHCVSGYITNYTCTNTELPDVIIRDSARSFLSGHSTFSCFLGYFMFWYIERRCRKMEPRVMKFVLQTAFLAFAVFCCLSRLTDHRHHWWDVLAGIVVGVAASQYTVNTACLRFATRIPKKISTTNNGSKPDSDIILTSYNIDLKY